MRITANNTSNEIKISIPLSLLVATSCSSSSEKSVEQKDIGKVKLPNETRENLCKVKSCKRTNNLKHLKPKKTNHENLYGKFYFMWTILDTSCLVIIFRHHVQLDAILTRKHELHHNFMWSRASYVTYWYQSYHYQ